MYFPTSSILAFTAFLIDLASSALLSSVRFSVRFSLDSSLISLVERTVASIGRSLPSLNFIAYSTRLLSIGWSVATSPILMGRSMTFFKISSPALPLLGEPTKRPWSSLIRRSVSPNLSVFVATWANLLEMSLISDSKAVTFSRIPLTIGTMD